MNERGTEEGALCGRQIDESEKFCLGTIELVIPEDCSCHISPPCSACVEAGLICNECGWRSRDD